MNDTLVSVPHQTVRRETPVRQAWLRRYSLAALRNTIAARRARTRFRWELKEMSVTNPHLIDDIGLTKREVEAEIAKLPFWQR